MAASDTYGVVHRLAGDGSEKGIGAFCIDWAFSKCGNLRRLRCASGLRSFLKPENNHEISNI